MGNAAALEVYGLIVPALAIFFLYVLPIPVVPNLLSRGIVAMESRSARGLTVLSVLAILTSFAFLGDFLTWQNKYAAKKSFFADISMKLQYENSRLRVERNIYIHILACILCLALKKCATLTMAASSQPGRATAASPSTNRPVEAAAAAPVPKSKAE